MAQPDLPSRIDAMTRRRDFLARLIVEMEGGALKVGGGTADMTEEALQRARLLLAIVEGRLAELASAEIRGTSAADSLLASSRSPLLSSRRGFG